MIFFKLLKRKRNLALFVLLCSFGAIGAFVYSTIESKKLSSAREMFVCNPLEVNQKGFLTIKVKPNRVDLRSYMDVINKKEKFISFNGGSIERNQKVKVLKYDFENQLAKVVILQSNATLAKPYREDHWIWSGYLHENKCN